MHSEEKFLIACARQHLCEETQELDLETNPYTDFDWEWVYTMAQQHGVAPLVSAALQRGLDTGLDVPPEIRTRFEQAYIYNVGVKTQVGRLLERFVAHFNQRSVKLMLFKGTAYDLLMYEQPWFTTHDVDLIIGARREELSHAELAEIQSLFVKLPGFEYDFYDHPDVTMKGVLPVDFDRIWADARKIEFRGQDVWVMCPEDMLLTACINSYRKRYFRLKSLLDIAALVQTQDLDWDAFIQKAAAYDCQAIVYTALKVSSQVLAYPLPASVLDRLGVGSVRRTLIHHLCQRLSLTAHSSLHNSRFIKLFARNIDLSLLLPYVTLKTDQAWRKLGYFFSDGAIFVRLWFQKTIASAGRATFNRQSGSTQTRRFD